MKLLKIVPLSILLALVFTLPAVKSSGSTRAAPLQCPTTQVNGAAAAWPKNALVEVWVGNLPANLQAGVATALANWNAANDSANNSGVHFVTSGGAPGVTSANGLGYIVVVNSGTPQCGTLGCVGGQSFQGQRLNATITLSSQITDSTAFTQTFAHEMGHTMGFGECTGCTASNQSVMAGASRGFNDTSGLSGPNSCDNARLNNSGYYPAGGRCSPALRDECFNNGLPWNWTLCQCGSGTEGTVPGDPFNCWSTESHEQRRVGFCTYYIRIVLYLCGGREVNRFEYVDYVDCSEIGKPTKPK